MAKNTMVLKTKSDKPVLTGPVLTATEDLEDIKEGDKLTSDAIQVKYLRLKTNADGASDDIDLPSETLLGIIRAIPDDNHSAWDKRADEARREYNKAHPKEDVSMSIPQTVKALAAQIADDNDFADTFSEFIETKKKTKYGDLLIMTALERVFEDSIDNWPIPDNDTEKGAPKDNPHYKWNGGIPAYDKGYRAKPKSEKATPSWYRDLFGAMPDVGSHRFGETITAEIVKLEKVKGKMDDREYERQIKDLNDEYTIGVGYLKNAMKLRFKLRAIGPVVKKMLKHGNDSVPAFVKESGLKNVGYIIRTDSKGAIERTTYPFIIREISGTQQTKNMSVGMVKALKPEDLPDDCSWQQLVDSGGTGTPDEDNSTPEATKYGTKEEVEAVLSTLRTTFADKHMWDVILRAIRLKDKKTGEYLHMPLVENLVGVLDNLESIKPTLDEIDRENQKRKDAMKAKQDREMKEAMAREGKTTTA